MFSTIICAIFITSLTIVLFKSIAEKINLIDKPNYRKQHKEPVAMIGGLSIYIAIIITSLIVGLPFLLNYLILTSSIVFLIGLTDDMFNIGIIIRLIFQIIASIFVIFSGLYVVDLGTINNVGVISFGIFSYFFTIFAVICLTNAFNFIYCLDGLAGGLILIALLSIILFQYFGKWIEDIQILTILISSVFIYWLVNMSLTPFKKIFLGDSGSLLLGFLISWLLIYYTHPDIRSFHPVLAIWCVTIPIFDSISVIIRRLILKSNIFLPDLIHIHHLLLNRNFSKKSTLFIILSLASLLSITGLVTFKFFGPMESLFTFLSLLAIYCIVSYKFMKQN